MQARPADTRQGDTGWKLAGWELYVPLAPDARWQAHLSRWPVRSRQWLPVSKS